ncbi:EAL domain-containing protein, partial [bacterium]|nr:EAL domain-containing protein [bacterium]
ALLTREGELGTLLSLVEKIERDEFDDISPLIECFNLSMANLAPVQLEACNWVNGMDTAD